MDPRPTVPGVGSDPEGPDPLSAVGDDLERLESASAQEQVEIFGRVHTALSGALAGTASDPAVPDPQPGG